MILAWRRKVFGAAAAAALGGGTGIVWASEGLPQQPPVVTQTLVELAAAPEDKPEVTQVLVEAGSAQYTAPIATQTLVEYGAAQQVDPRVSHVLVEIASSGSIPMTIACVPSSAVRDVPYGYAFTVTGESLELTFAITAGALPSGLSLDATTGVVSGVPTTVGTYAYTIQVTNEDGDSVSASCSIVVAAPAAPPLTYEGPCAIQTPLVHATFQDASGTVRFSAALRTAIRDAATAYGGYKPPRLGTVGPIVRASSDWLTRAWQVQSAEATFADTDRLVANLSSLPSLKGGQLYVYLTSQTNRLLGATRRLMFQGPVYSDVSSDFLRTVTANDIIGVEYDLFTGDKQIPQRTISKTDFPGAQSGAVNLGVPVIGGRVTDENNTLGGGADTGSPGYGVRIQNGAVPGIDVGDATIGGLTRRWVLFAGHANKKYRRLCCNQPGGPITIVDGVPTTGGISTSLYGAGIDVPGEAGAPFYYDINGRRYSLVGVSDTTLVNQLNTGYTLRANIDGYETVGDGTGTLEEDASAQFERLLLNWLIGNYQSGAWLTTPQFELFPGSGIVLDRVNHAAFVVASLVASSLLTGGFKGAFVIGARGQLTTSSQVIQDALRSWNLMMRWNQFNQIEVVMLDRRRSSLIGSKRAVTWQQDILAQPRFALNRRPEWFCNGLAPMFYEPVYAAGAGTQPGDWFSGRQMSDGASQAMYGVVNRKDALTLPYVFDHETARVSAQQYLDFAAVPREVATWAQSLCGLANDVLDGVPVTHYTGRGSSGWSNRATWILGQRINAPSATVEIDAVDVDDLLA